MFLKKNHNKFGPIESRFFSRTLPCPFRELPTPYKVSSLNTSCNEAKLRITGLLNFDENTRKGLISPQLLVT
jgi:hypothetical protein